MSVDTTTRLASLERLSALVDGELDDDTAVAKACAQWREDADARTAWHDYQLIGDLLRSDDLALGAGRSAAFLSALRVRLSREPVVLAPQARADSRQAPEPEAALMGIGKASNDRAQGHGHWWSWKTPAAVAAGFMAVAGVMILARGPAVLEPEAASVVAVAASQQGFMPSGAPAALASAVAEPEAVVTSGEVLRDARLDRYLAAHKQFAGSSVLGVPSAFLRRATADASNR